MTNSGEKKRTNRMCKSECGSYAVTMFHIPYCMSCYDKLVERNLKALISEIKGTK